jgi:predicted dehydrogenase
MYGSVSFVLIAAAISLLIAPPVSAQEGGHVKRIGIIGLDTSHSPAFTRIINDPDARPEMAGYRVVAAYPHGSRDIESSVSRIPRFTEEMEAMGIEIVETIEALLDRVDAVLLNTNDGRLHLEQALLVFRAGKPVFIDKPIAASLVDAIAIFEAARHYGVPVFSASGLRFMESAQEVRAGRLGRVLGADTHSPAHLEPTHPDLFWYGIHGVETLYTLMGTGCETVVRVHSDSTDVVVGRWSDGRIGTFRGQRQAPTGYGGTVFGAAGITTIGPFGGYGPLVLEIIRFFETGVPPVSEDETIEIFAFMEAADESRRRNGSPVTLASVLESARAEAQRKVALYRE